MKYTRNILITLLVIVLFVAVGYLSFVNLLLTKNFKKYEETQIGLNSKIDKLEVQNINGDTAQTSHIRQIEADMMVLQDEIATLKAKKFIVRQDFVELLLGLNTLERVALRGEDLTKHVINAKSLGNFDPTIIAYLKQLDGIKTIKSKNHIIHELRTLVSEIQYLKYKKDDDIVSKVKKFIYKYIVFIKKDSNLYRIEGLLEQDLYEDALSLLKTYEALPSNNLKLYIYELQNRIIFYNTLDEIYLYIAYCAKSSKVN
jgi:hypothetical protein